jgi:hypothetical protein
MTNMVSEGLLRLRIERDIERDALARIKAGLPIEGEFITSAEQEAAWEAPAVEGEAEALRTEIAALGAEWGALAEQREAEEDARAEAEHRVWWDSLTEQERAAHDEALVAEWARLEALYPA